MLRLPYHQQSNFFLGNHISTSYNHRYARNGEFVVPDVDGIVILNNICSDIFDSSDSFVDKSKEIASHLFDKDTSRPGKPSASDLIVCLYSENGSDNQWLALLKMEPNEGFVTEEMTDASGQRYYALRPVNDVIVSTDLQKSALIAPPSLRASLGYDLRLLDNQQSRSEINRIAASFFTTDFLQCKVGLNASDKTRRLLIAGENWLNTKSGLWSINEIDDARSQLKSAALGNRVDLTSLAQTITPDADDQDEFMEAMRRRIDESVFDTDPSTARDMTSWTVFEGDRGIKISVPSELLGNNSYFNKTLNQATNTWTITIKTVKLKEKPRSRA